MNQDNYNSTILLKHYTIQDVIIVNGCHLYKEIGKKYLADNNNVKVSASTFLEQLVDNMHLRLTIIYS